MNMQKIFRYMKLSAEVFDAWLDGLFEFHLHILRMALAIMVRTCSLIHKHPVYMRGVVPSETKTSNQTKFSTVTLQEQKGVAIFV